VGAVAAGRACDGEQRRLAGVRDAADAKERTETPECWTRAVLSTTRNPDTFGGQKPPKISDYRRKQVIFGGF